MSDSISRPWTSPSIAALAGALAKAQGKFTNPQKDRDNPFFKSKYATLDALIDSTRTVLAENELSVVQVYQTIGGGLHLCTRLNHSSGEWIESVVPLLTTKEGAQKLGSETTYLRRYSYGAILSITADEDDDGNAAQTARKKDAAPKPIVAPAPPPEPPYDPITGEIIPHMIAVTFKGDNADWITWGGSFIAAMKKCATRAEGETWLAANAAALDNCAHKAPKAHSSVTKAIKAMFERCPEEVPEGGMREEPEFMDEADAADALVP